GVVEYLNAMPLWHGLREDADVELVAAKPSELAALLREGAIDTGLLPVIEYFRNPGVLLAKGMGVACRGAVRSVLIFLKKPVPEVKRVRLDASSRTSQCLTRIVLEELYGLQPEYREAAIAPSELLRMEEDAALMI